MAGGCAWSRRAAARMRTLRGLVRDTQKALHDIADILHFDPEIFTTVNDIGGLSSRCTAIVVLGTTPAARARLLHCLLGRRILPDPAPRGCRWLRIQYGSTTQVHLTLGNSEFELVEELECNKKPWETLPLQDLLRQEQTDLSTMLEVELNNQFLKDGLKIIVPPDLEIDPGPSNYLTLKELHSDLFKKRDSILRDYNPIYLYAIDKIGKNVFCDNLAGKIVASKSEEDFWTTYNLYQMTRGGGGGDDVSEVVATNGVEWKESDEPAVFTAENCLDLHQLKELNPHSQVHFILLSDSRDIGDVNDDVTGEGRVSESTESAAACCNEELPESDRGLLQDGRVRCTQESPEQTNTLTDDRRLYEEQIAFMNELLDQWEFMSSPIPKHYAKSQWSILDDIELFRTLEEKTSLADKRKEEDRRVRSRTALLNTVVKFAGDCMQSYLLEYCSRLSEIHVKLLQQFILASFDLARELQIVPKKIQYVATQERLLYETINDKFSEGEKKQELLKIMQDVLQEMKTEINNMDWSVDDLPCHQDKRFTISNSIFYSSSLSSRNNMELSPRQSPTCGASCGASCGARCGSECGPECGRPPAEVEEAVSYDSYNFDDYDIIHNNDSSLSEYYYRRDRPRAEDTASLNSQIGLIPVENENEMSSMSFMKWTSLTSDVRSEQGSVCTNAHNVSAANAARDVQQTVLSKLSRKISLKLVTFVDCLRETYFGTLQRCLESLEYSCRAELGGRPASEAMRRLVSVARQVQLAPSAAFSLLHSLLHSVRRLFHKLRILDSEADGACCTLSPTWRRHVALRTLQSLSPQRLARIISAQILERLSVAHEKYQSALESLESALANRLHHTEDVKLAIRKKYAPAFARLCLESTSMCDQLMYGTPELGREIGRGQYGVVYQVRGGWAGRAPCAVKSVLPADERHYHELAMEFFYTRSIPPHPRIVRLYGSIVQRYGAGGGAGGGGPGVLLVSERKVRDLHAAVRAGLSFRQRIRISADIVQGIRYLHSLGLVHRDIKMKNVLLDASGRAALSDLGFCAAEALISGSVVGTPVHMAPELLNGEYDASVDVYAFGILFWYVCAGNIKLPSAFETFQNKEQLWSKVKKGLRPERLPHFSDECWDIMQSCWASEPSRRALLGDVEPRLQHMFHHALDDDPQDLQDQQDLQHLQHLAAGDV